jgi:hypothetical protein
MSDLEQLWVNAGGPAALAPLAAAIAMAESDSTRASRGRWRRIRDFFT